jgi:hypothetical protein
MIESIRYRIASFLIETSDRFYEGKLARLKSG